MRYSMLPSPSCRVLPHDPMGRAASSLLRASKRGTKEGLFSAVLTTGCRARAAIGIRDKGPLPCLQRPYVQLHHEPSHHRTE